MPLPILATWSQSVSCLAEAPSDEGNLGRLSGLFCQLRCCVRLNKEHNLGLTIDELRSEKTLKNIVAQLLNRVVAPELLKEVSTHVEPFCKWQGHKHRRCPGGICPGTCGHSVLAESGHSD